MDVRKVAKLAHLEITDEEVALYTPQMDEHRRLCRAVKRARHRRYRTGNRRFDDGRRGDRRDRADAPHESLGQKLALEQAPDAHSGHFRVPKVL